jgi:hypothetical protein
MLCSLALEYRTIDKVQKPSNSERSLERYFQKNLNNRMHKTYLLSPESAYQISNQFQVHNLTL